jgi:hypothetical protein
MGQYCRPGLDRIYKIDRMTPLKKGIFHRKDAKSAKIF